MCKSQNHCRSQLGNDCCQYHLRLQCLLWLQYANSSVTADNTETVQTAEVNDSQMRAQRMRFRSQVKSLKHRLIQQRSGNPNAQ
jgi:hypothetical protein